MVIAVLERRSEIGLRRALGATKRHIAPPVPDRVAAAGRRSAALAGVALGAAGHRRLRGRARLATVVSPLGRVAAGSRRRSRSAPSPVSTRPCGPRGCPRRRLCGRCSQDQTAALREGSDGAGPRPRRRLNADRCASWKSTARGSPTTLPTSGSSSLVIVPAVIPAATRPLDLKGDPAAVTAPDDGLHIAHPGVQAGEPGDALEPGAAGDLDALDASLAVVEAEGALLAVDREDGDLELPDGG